jgi:hypothetical protein
LEVHELDGREAEALVRARSTGAPNGVRLLKHWLGGDGRTVALLVEAPDEQTLRTCPGNAKEITELFARAERWLSHDSIEM